MIGTDRATVWIYSLKPEAIRVEKVRTQQESDSRPRIEINPSLLQLDRLDKDEQLVKTTVLKLLKPAQMWEVEQTSVVL